MTTAILNEDAQSILQKNHNYKEADTYHLWSSKKHKKARKMII